MTTPLATAASEISNDGLTPPPALVGSTPTPDDKPADDKPADDKPADDKPAAEPFDAAKLTIPEGITLDPELSAKFGEIAKELNVDQEGAQKLFDLHSNAIKAAAAQPYKLWADTQKAWQDEIKADPEIGGDKLQSNLATVSKVIDQYGDQSTRDAFNTTGAGNNPAITKLMVKMARALTEGGIVPAGSPSSVPPKGDPRTLYPGLPVDRNAS